MNFGIVTPPYAKVHFNKIYKINGVFLQSQRPPAGALKASLWLALLCVF